jgi:hypothetical protein
MKPNDLVEDANLTDLRGIIKEVLPDNKVKVWWLQGHFHQVVSQNEVKLVEVENGRE